MTAPKPPTCSDITSKTAQHLRRLVRVAATLVILALVGYGIALLNARHQTEIAAARFNNCRSHLTQIYLALRNYAEAHGHYPPAYTTSPDGKPLHSWRTLILPFMEAEQLYRSIDLRKPWDDSANAAARQFTPDFFRCPAAFAKEGDDHGLTTYLAVVAPESVIRAVDSATLRDIKASHTQTVTVTDVPHDKAVHWMSPQDADEQDFLQSGAAHSGQHRPDAMLVLCADGHCTVISADLDAASRRAMITVSADDNEAIKDD